MSGHSHWASIKHKKGAADARKGKAFSKASRLLMVAARDGGTDPKMNLRLQYAIDKAREVNMPRETIDKAIKKGAGETEGVKFEKVFYEGYGPGGVAFMIEALTDNRNRTVSEVRKIVETKGGNLGSANCVSWLFESKGFFTIPVEVASEDDLIALGLEVEADNVELVGDTYEIICDPKDFEKVKTALAEKKFIPKTAEVTLIPKTYVTVEESTGRKLLGLINALEDHDDVQNVYANFDLPETLVSPVRD